MVFCVMYFLKLLKINYNQTSICTINCVLTLAGEIINWFFSGT